MLKVILIHSNEEYWNCEKHFFYYENVQMLFKRKKNENKIMDWARHTALLHYLMFETFCLKIKSMVLNPCET